MASLLEARTPWVRVLLPSFVTSALAQHAASYGSLMPDICCKLTRHTLVLQQGTIGSLSSPCRTLSASDVQSAASGPFRILPLPSVPSRPLRPQRRIRPTPAGHLQFATQWTKKLCASERATGVDVVLYTGPRGVHTSRAARYATVKISDRSAHKHTCRMCLSRAIVILWRNCCASS